MKARKKKTKTPSRKAGKPACDVCKHHDCSDGKDCFGARDAFLLKYREDGDLHNVARAAARVEAEHYGAATRLEEIVHFARAAGFSRLGLAFCAGFREEARIAGGLLRTFFKVTSVCCKICGVPKEELDFPKVRPGRAESICNPIAQAEFLNRAKTDLNVVMGLCVGHDALFNRHSEALVTTLVAKDRVLAHNPVGAIYCPYVQKRLKEGLFAV
jgi:uncharacterized metal-binding protein